MAKIFVEMTEEEYEQYKKMKKDLSDIKNNVESPEKINIVFETVKCEQDIIEFIKKYGYKSDVFTNTETEHTIITYRYICKGTTNNKQENEEGYTITLKEHIVNNSF